MAAIRARDSDRDDTCRILDAALNEGQLSAEEHRQRVSAATSAVTLADLHALLTDLQSSSATVQLTPLASQPKYGSWGIVAAALGVAVVLGMGIGWGVYGKTGSPLGFSSDHAASAPGARPDGVPPVVPDGVPPVVVVPPKDLQSLDGLNGLFDQARKKFGDTMGLRLVVFSDYAVLDRLDPTEQRRKLSYDYRGGWGDPTTSGNIDGNAAVDLGHFDRSAAIGILRGAPQTLGVKASDVTNTYLLVEPSSDPTTPGAVSLSAYVTTNYGGGYIQFAADGTVGRVTPPS